MTHDKDAERQAFEAWLGINPCGAAHDLAWSAWKAARRAPAAPVPQEVARLRNAISRCADFIEHAPVSSGVCCCGDSMEGHADPMVSGHVAVDEWDWSASCMVQELRAIIAAAPQPPEAAPVPQALTDAQITIACMSYRHDFGLMHASERKSLIFQARELERALNKARGAA